MHSTKQHLLFIRGFGELEKKWSEPVLISRETLQHAISPLEGEGQGVGARNYVGELIESQQAELPQLTPLQGLRSIEETLPSLLTKVTYEKKSLLPWYGRGA